VVALMSERKFDWSKARTPGGLLCEEASSWLQKSLRRGLEVEALTAARELTEAGYGGYVWRRLRVVGSEDVGLAEPGMQPLLETLQSCWERERKKNEQLATIFIVHAIVALARAPKSRLIDDIGTVVWWEAERRPLELPDDHWAIDRHVKRGRQLGRGWAEFYDQGAKLEHEAALPNAYAAEARAVRVR
jgi:replication-associated recombination protein RarA